MLRTVLNYPVGAQERISVTVVFLVLHIAT